MSQTTPHGSGRSAGEHAAAEMRGRNLRTALILLSIAAVFFGGIIVKRWLFVGQ